MLLGEHLMSGLFENIFVSFLSNLFHEKWKKIDEFKTSKELEDQKEAEALLKLIEGEKKPPKPIPFRSFCISKIEHILSFINNPVVHFVIDNEPSFYFTVVAIVESPITGEWYVFGNGEIAFQGRGGGYRKCEMLCEILRKRNLTIAIWCTTQILLKELLQGKLTWPLLKPQLFPFLAVNNQDKDWNEVNIRLKEFFPRLFNEEEEW